MRGEIASGHASRLTLDDVRALLDEQRHALDRPDRSGETIGLLRKLARESAEASDAFAERLGGTLAEGLAELRAAVDRPRDDALYERLDRIDAALASPDSTLEPLAEVARRLDALEPIKAALDELCSTAAEPAGARFLERLVARSHNQIAERIGELQQAVTGPAAGAEADALAERDARIAELVEQLNARPATTAAPADDRPRPGDTTSFLALVPASDGYRLVALEGTLPAAGDWLAVPDDDRALVVARLGRFA